ncbi:RnfABCDGE type electron transport complex subunit D [Dethiobacter alkaliphilus]|uniref:RnfABCDGE type electron transport complex subunit D n=1 Tax=Dethiobacter alkaliphilus TaxID=427926 RepID=UPI00222714B9|nr:RnfABCDGE type electron transport complex subunit D [Dethiobacter alkaliphilus]MCW3489895.1 RnfABCDGE type electron transport complex subunit D [Dethiobacter alkaliphilus]
MKMFRGMLLALTPAALLAIYYYRMQAVMLIGVGIISAIVSEAVFQYIFKKKPTFTDGSAAITGLLLALAVSPSTPLYVLAASTAVGIVAGKQIFGGFPQNIFNPALLGRLFLIYAFPGALTPWLTPVDMVSTATPLQNFRETGVMAPVWNLFTGNVPGSMGEMSAAALLLGAAYLIYKKYANWRIPVSCLLAVVVMALFTGQNPFFHIFSGSLILGAFFMATDPATSPKTDMGRWIFGALIGVIVMSIRLWGWLPEGTTFAILGMNYFVPFINTETKRIIEVKKQQKEQQASAQAANG